MNPIQRWPTASRNLVDLILSMLLEVLSNDLEKNAPAKHMEPIRISL